MYRLSFFKFVLEVNAVIIFFSFTVFETAFSGVQTGAPLVALAAGTKGWQAN